MATLYKMTEQAATLYELLQDEIIDVQTFNDTLEGMGVNEKVEGYCQIIKQLQSDTAMYKGEIQRLQDRNRTAENAIDRMKRSLLDFMEQSGQKKIKAGSFSVSVASSQSLEVVDEKLIPPEFLEEQAPKVDKVGIKEALKEGIEINGVKLITGKGVRIR